VKMLNGKPTDVSPSGAAARESVFLQSYRAEIAHFIAVVNETTPYDPPEDQLMVIKLMEAIYKAAEEGKEVRL
jgi:predicted dehydrogenase